MQQYADIYLLQSHSTCFGCPSHPSSGVQKTVIAASGTGHNTGTATSLQRGLLRPHWREVAVAVVNKYLHTVASGWIFINIELRCTEPRV